MTPTEAARRLADPTIGVQCDHCTGSPVSGHFEGCPVLAVPRIVAALEAAERVAKQNGRLSDGRIGSCPVCGGGAMAGDPIFDQSHRGNCPMKALVAALRGEKMVK